jgi:hypothetical protein
MSGSYRAKRVHMRVSSKKTSPKKVSSSRKAKEKILDNPDYTSVMDTRRHFVKEEFKPSTNCICYNKEGWHYQHALCPVHMFTVVVGFEPKSQSVRVSEGVYERDRRR